MHDTKRRAFPSATMPVVAQPSQSSQRPKRMFWTLISVTTLVTIGGATVWILSQAGVIQSFWATLCGIIFAVLGFLLTALQLIAQFTPTPTTSTPISGSRQLGRDLPSGTTRNKGAIAVLVNNQLAGSTIYLSKGFDRAHMTPISVANIGERNMDGQFLLVGFFPTLEPGNYTIYTHTREYIDNVSVRAGHMTVVDWRQARPLL